MKAKPLTLALAAFVVWHLWKKKTPAAITGDDSTTVELYAAKFPWLRLEPSKWPLSGPTDVASMFIGHAVAPASSRGVLQSLAAKGSPLASYVLARATGMK